MPLVKITYRSPAWLVILSLLLLMSTLGLSVYVGYVKYDSILFAVWPLVASAAILVLCCARGPIGRPLYRHCRETAVMRVSMRLRSDHPDKAADWLADEPPTPAAVDWAVAFVAMIAMIALNLGVADLADASLLDSTAMPFMLGFVSTMTAWRGSLEGRARADDLAALASKEL